jgi:hypothetical protein
MWVPIRTPDDREIVFDDHGGRGKVARACGVLLRLDGPNPIIAGDSGSAVIHNEKVDVGVIHCD